MATAVEATEAPEAQDGPDPKAERSRPGQGLVELGERFALPLILLGLVAFFALLPASGAAFWAAANLKIVLANQAILLVVCLAILFPIVTNSWDFTPGATAGLCAIVAASVVNSSGSLAIAGLVALGTGAVIGAANGILVTRMRVNSVIATLGMTIIISGLVQWITDGNALVAGIPQGVTDFGSNSLLGVPYLMWTGLVLAIITFYILRQTVYGRDLYAIGSSRAAARLVGLRIERFIFSTYLVSGCIAAVAGFLLLARSGSGNPTVGPGYLLPAYAAVFLGATTITPGRWNVWGIVVAVLFLGVLNSGLVLAGANSYVNDFANGIALLVGVGVANLFAHRRGGAPEMS